MQGRLGLWLELSPVEVNKVGGLRPSALYPWPQCSRCLAVTDTACIRGKSRNLHGRERSSVETYSPPARVKVFWLSTVPLEATFKIVADSSEPFKEGRRARPIGHPVDTLLKAQETCHQSKSGPRGRTARSFVFWSSPQKCDLGVSTNQGSLFWESTW